MNKRIKRSLLAVFFLVFVVLSACSNDSGADSNDEGSNDTASNDSSEEYKIRISHLIPTDNAAHLAAEVFKEEVEAQSDNKISVDIFPNGELYSSDRETIEAIQMDNIEMTIGGTTTLGNFDDNFYVLDLPYLFNDRYAAREALSGELGEKLTENLADINLVSLGFGYDGVRHITNNKAPIEQLDDLKGLKIRVQESEIQSDIFNALGTNSSPLAFGEVYTALQQNTFDGIDSTATLIVDSKFYEVQDYMSLTGHTYSGAIILLSHNFFSSLPEDLQEVVLAAGKNMETVYYEYQDEAEDAALEQIKDEGLMEVNEIDDAKREEFVEAVESVYDKYTDKIDSELIDIARSYNK